MKRTIILILSLLTVTILSASPADTLWTKANTLYTAENYEESAKLYEQILATGVESPDLYYNLGNAYYKQNMIAPSILNYERALRLSPENEDIKHNLEMVRLQQLDKINAVPDLVLERWYNSVLQLASSNGWGILGIVLFAACLFLSLIYFFTSRFGLRKLAFFLSILSLLLAITCIVFASQQRDYLLNKSQAIIFVPVVTVKSSPDSNGKDLFIIHEGLKVKIIDEIGSWSRIVLSDGNQGWAPAESMQQI